MISSAETIEKYALYAAYGKAMLGAHALELWLGNFLMTTFLEEGVSDKQFSSELEKIKRKTMGGLISEIYRKCELTDYWEEELDNALFFRNRLAHKISEDIISSHFKDNGKVKLIEEMEEIGDYFSEAKIEIKRLTFQRLKNETGIEKQHLSDIARSWLESNESNQKTA